MKNLIPTLILILVLATSCNNTKNTKEVRDDVMKTNKGKTDTNTPTNLTFDWQEDMALDNGKKWQANPETTEGIQAMLELVNNHDMSTVKSFKQLGDDLNIIKNYTIKSCTMKGKSHDNLHVFLLPLMEKISELSNVSSTPEGHDLQGYIQEHLELYTTYFITDEY